MARYTGPKTKINRRFGVPIFGSSKSFERRNYPPGQHGARSVRRKRTDYGIALAEKQKLRYTYGLLEKPFRRLFAEAVRRRGVTGQILLQLLECRLDNVLYRLGFGNTRDGARQFVNHGHVQVNGRRVDIPSYQIKPGDKISVQDKSSSKQLAIRLLDQTQIKDPPDWVTVDREKCEGSIVRFPEGEDLETLVNVQLVVELYSR